MARRHSPRSCYFVIKMIPKIPPCFGFPLRSTPFFGGRHSPVHSRIANSWISVCWNLDSADFSKELNFKNAFSVGRNTKISGYLARKFCVLCKRLEFYDSAWIVFTFHRSEGEALNVCLAEVHVTPFALSLSCVLCLVLLENGIEVAVE